MSQNRIDLHTYFLLIAKAASLRATCPRRLVGTVLVENGRVVGTGYNGSIPGYGHCTDEGCLLFNGHCIRTIHAEANAEANCIGNADTAYCTDTPCLSCLKIFLAHGVKDIYYAKEYADITRDQFVKSLGIEFMFHHHPMDHVILEVEENH
jgi:dCMP deaminase